MKKVILAGGGGTRLWPVSTEENPKQFISIFSDRSLLQETFARLQKIDGDKDSIYFSSNQKYGDKILQQIGCDKDKLILEPQRKNTAPAIALIVKYLEDVVGCKPEEVILIAPSDHIIAPEGAFIKCVQIAIPEAEKGSIVTFGIAPHTPETGYGYINVEPRTSDAETGLCKVIEYVEKPDLTTAQKYLDSGNYLWNAGIFMFTIKTIKESFAQYCPDLFTSMQGSYSDFLMRFDSLEAISIDCAVMEKASNITMCPMDVTWSDIGSRDAISELLVQQKVVNTNPYLINDDKNNLVFSKRKLIIDAITDSFIILSEAGSYIAKKGNSQALKDSL